MDPTLPADSWFAFVLGLVALSSLAVWPWILARRVWQGAVLPFEPRQPVPWGWIAALPALAMLSFAILAIASPGHAPLDVVEVDDAAVDDTTIDDGTVLEDDATVSEMIEQIATSAALVAIVTLGCLLVVAVNSAATTHDLGLPKYAHQLARDIGIGVVAFLAAMIPVYALQAALVYGLGEKSSHPLLEMIMQDPDPLLLAMAFFSAVVVAPICEEVAFRLLLQGWLEKVVGSRRKVVGSGQWAVGSETESDQQKLAATGRVAGEPETDGEHDNPYESPINQSDSFQPPDSSLQTNSSGYRPIFVSSLLFALAHYGHGPDPIPLFFLATILGYTYHRTHRIVPCIVAHALFNAFSLVTLMVMLFQAKQ